MTNAMTRIPFRQRILLVTALSAFTVVLLFAVVTYFTMQRSLLAALDERLHNDYELVSIALYWQDGVLRQREAQHAHVDNEQENPPLVEVRDLDGVVVLFEFAANGALLAGAMPPFSKQPGYRTDQLSSRHAVRTVVKPMTVAGVSVWVRITRGLDRVNADMWQLVQTFLAITPVAALFCMLLGWWGARALVRPVQALETAVAGIGAQQLSRRVPVSAANDELAHLATQFNAMLARIEASFVALEQFSADVAHELRTPLMAIQAGAEGALTQHDPHAWKRGLHDSLEHVSRLALLVDRLLLLARADRGALPLALKQTDLPTLLQQVQSLMQPLLDTAEINLSVHAQPASAACDEALMTQVLIDLIDNAMRHGDGPITLSCSSVLVEGRLWASVEISDCGTGIGEADHSRALARFGRLDAARAHPSPNAPGSDSPHRSASGLGLAIAQSILHAHGGRLTLHQAAPRGLHVRLQWPSI